MFSPNQQHNRAPTGNGEGSTGDFSFSPHLQPSAGPSPPPSSFPSSPLSPTPAMSHSLNSLIQRDAHNYSPDFSKDVLQPMQGGAPMKSPPGSCPLPPLRSVVGEFLPQPSLGMDVDMGKGSSGAGGGSSSSTFPSSPLKRRAQTGLTSPVQHYQPAPMSPLGFPSSPQQQYQLRQQQQQQQLQQQLHSPFQLPQEHPSPMTISSSSVMQNLSSCRSPTPGEMSSPLQGMRSPTGSPFDPTHNHYSQGSSSGMGGGSNSPFGNPTFSMQTQGYGGGTGGGSGFGPPRGFPSSKHARDLDRRASFSDPGSTMETHHAHIPMSGMSEKGMGHEEPKKKGRHCWVCGVSKTPRWRRGPDNRQLCNSCGLRYIRKKKKEIERKAPNTSSPSPMNFE